MGFDLPVIWAVIILFGVMMYMVMDGFDLGVGVLFLFLPRREDRNLMVSSIAPVWDGNETWLVLGGAGLLAAFPLAYSVVLSAFFLPLIFMLLGLIFRGVAFEFRSMAIERQRPFWDKAFMGGSICAAFFQGATLGAYLQGIEVVDRAYQGGAWDWVSPFSVFTGVAVVIAYALLGCTWLILKTEGDLQQRMVKLAAPLTVAVLLELAMISIWTPLVHPPIAERWFSTPNIFFLAPVPLLAAAAGGLLLRSLHRAPNAAPFVLALAMILLGYLGLGISLWPNIIPPSVSIWQASSPIQSQGFVLVGALVVVPVILMYTAWSYYVFRGKVRAEGGYR